MKTYSVKITAFATVVVEVEDDEDPTMAACDLTDFGDLQLDSGGPATELTAEQIPDAKRHADKFHSL